jgi:predicted ATP-grasp superfamily ATP-dependent carboligase
METKAVVLGTNYYIGLSIIRTLGYEGVKTIAVDYVEDELYSSKSKYLHSHVMAPSFKDDPQGYIDKLVSIAKAEETKPLLFPSADPYAEFIDENLDQLKEHFLIPMVEKGLWTRVMKKESLFHLATEHGVLVPETIEDDDPNLAARVEKELGYPCIVKPVDSPPFVAKFRRKVLYCTNEAELTESLSKTRKEGLKVIVQRIIPGFDDHMYTFDFHVDQSGKVSHWATCRKLRQFPINFGASVYTEQKYVPELAEIGIPFIEKIGYRGFGEIEFKKDEKTGKFYLIEINTRTTTLNVLLHKAGINFPYVCYRDMTGSPLQNKAITEDTGYVFQYLFEDIFACRDYMRKGQLSAGQIAKSLFRKKAPAIWSLDDPMPAINYIGIILGKASKKLFR